MEEAAKIRTVLLVEDSDDDAFFFERAFLTAKTGAPFVRFSDGGSAVEYLERGMALSPGFSATHLMFLDLKLPVLSGFDVLRWIGEHNCPLEVVVLSGSDLDTDVNQARELGASDYLVKPVSSEQIKQRLSQVAKVANRP